jgi:hypothetical protein
MRWIIKDWADNELFPNKDFSTFEDAWGFIYEFFNDEDFQELSVVQA